MKNKTLHKDLQKIEIDKVLSKKKQMQRKLTKRYEYLQKVETKYFKYEYLKAQAQRICELDLELRLSPFRSLYSNFLAMISDPAFLTSHCVRFNKYGILEVDKVALAEYKPIQIDFGNIDKPKS